MKIFGLIKDIVVGIAIIYGLYKLWGFLLKTKIIYLLIVLIIVQISIKLYKKFRWCNIKINKRYFNKKGDVRQVTNVSIYKDRFHITYIELTGKMGFVRVKDFRKWIKS